MKEIKVLGSGCAKCVKTAGLIQAVANACSVDVHVIKDTSPEAMLKHGIMSTPAVVIDDQVVHTGSIPDKSKIEAWLT